MSWTVASGRPGARTSPPRAIRVDPPRQPQRRVVGAAQQSAADVGDPAGQRRRQEALRPGLVRAVALAVLPHRAVLPDRLGRPAGVDVDGGDEGVVVRAAAQAPGPPPRPAPACSRTCRRSRPSGRRPSAAGRSSTRSPRSQVTPSGGGGPCRPRLRTVTSSPAAQRRRDDVTAEEDGPAQDEEPHEAQPISCDAARCCVRRRPWALRAAGRLRTLEWWRPGRPPLRGRPRWRRAARRAQGATRNAWRWCTTSSWTSAAPSACSRP